MDVFHKPTRVLGKEMEAVVIVDVGKGLQAKSVFLHLEKHPPPPGGVAGCRSVYDHLVPLSRDIKNTRKAYQDNHVPSSVWMGW